MSVLRARLFFLRAYEHIYFMECALSQNVLLLLLLLLIPVCNNLWGGNPLACKLLTAIDNIIITSYYTQILLANLSVFVYRLLHDDFSPIMRTNFR